MKPNRMQSLFRLPVLALAALALTCASCSRAPGEREFEKGIHELNRGNYVRARSLFEKSIERRPGHELNARAYNYAGVASWRLGQFADAMSAFEDSRRLNPMLFEPVYNMGVLSSERGDMRMAVRYLNEAAAMNRDDTRALEYLGHSYMRRGQWSLARNSLYAALDRRPGAPAIHTALAEVELSSGETERAIEALMHALDSDPRYAPALFNLGVVYESHYRNAAEAEAYFKKYLAIAKNETYEAYADQALDRLEQGLEPPPAEGTLMMEGDVVRIGETTTAVTIEQEDNSSPNARRTTLDAPAASEDPYDRSMREAAAAAEQGRMQQALALYGRAADIADGDRRSDLQERALQEAAATCFELPEAHVRLAAYLFDRGRFEPAARSYKKALAIDGKHPGALLGFARTAVQQREYDAALVTLKTLVQEHPENADGTWELALLYDRNLDLPEVAARTYRRFAETFPSDSRVDAGLDRAETLAPAPRRTETVSPASEERTTVTASGEELAYKKPVQRNTSSAIQAFNRASEYQRRREWDRAIFFYLRSLENDDRISSTFYNLGICYAMAGDTARAMAAYRGALELQPDMVNARYNLALLHQEEGEMDDAVRLMQAIIRDEPDYAKAHYALGVLYSRDASTYGLARRHYQRFLALAPTDRSAAVVRQWLANH